MIKSKNVAHLDPRPAMGIMTFIPCGDESSVPIEAGLASLMRYISSHTFLMSTSPVRVPQTDETLPVCSAS